MEQMLKKDPPAVMTLEQIAEMFQCSTKTVRRHMVKDRKSGIDWLKTPWGKIMATRKSVELYMQRLQAKTLKNMNPIIPSPFSRRGG